MSEQPDAYAAVRDDLMTGEYGTKTVPPAPWWRRLYRRFWLGYPKKPTVREQIAKLLKMRLEDQREIGTLRQHLAASVTATRAEFGARIEKLEKHSHAPLEQTDMRSRLKAVEDQRLQLWATNDKKLQIMHDTCASISKRCDRLGESIVSLEDTLHVRRRRRLADAKRRKKGKR